jgi:hypothetical protein
MEKIPKSNEVSVSAEFIEMIVRLNKIFNGDYIKTRMWLITPNLNVGGFAPLKLFAIGKADKVFQFIEDAEKK